MLHPVVGFHGRSWVDGLLRSTADVAIAGFLLKEDDSTNGDPFLVSKFKQRPKRGGRVTKCVREILVMVCDMPRGQVGKFRISSFRKFKPTIAKLLKLEGIAVQTSVGGLVVSLKRTDLFLKAEFPASSQLARLYFQTNTHRIWLCRFVRICVFFSEKRAKPFLHAEVSTTFLSLTVGIPYPLLLPSPLYPPMVSTLTTVRVIHTQNNNNI